jgi:hypothetical protein
VSGRRFGLLLTLLVLVLAAASFAVTSALLDDGPVSSSGDSSTSSSTSTTTTTTVLGELATPTFVAVVSSEGDEFAAGSIADDLTERGYDSGVLRSGDYASLDPGYWVAYVGPFADAAAAQEATNRLISDGYGAAYPRCVGTVDECA